MVDRRTRVWWLNLGMAVVAAALAYIALEVLEPVDHDPSVPWWGLPAARASERVGPQTVA